MIKRIFTLCFLLPLIYLHAQEGEKVYFPDPDPLVQQKLEQWQDLKFGLLMHWGTYSQWGIVESWSICPEDYGWCERKKGNNPNNYVEYVNEYENLKTTFNPIDFDPERWAKAAKDAGMRYVVFTTKHHDGFCMFDTKLTDYKITDEGCPFHSNPKANITKEIFDAFRAEGMWVGPYFSKPDWHNDYYWDPYFPPMDRNVNYDPVAYPEKWENFVQYTQNQIMELMSDYGKIDILWLDGGWVARQSENEITNFYDQNIKETTSGFMKSKIVNQDIRMDELVEKARQKQPGLIVVDRAVPGKNQNYLTPENTVPKEALPYPWESCIIAGGGWSWTPEATYMTGHDAIHLLVDIVAKGGNLLLNIAPGPEGQWHDGAYQLLNEIGDWMKVNSESIYETSALPPYKEGNICFTQKKDGSVYLIYLAGKDEIILPPTLRISSLTPDIKANIKILGTDNPLKWEKVSNDLIIEIPETIRNHPPCQHAWVFKVTGFNENNK